jgi:hypothetical protein
MIASNARQALSGIRPANCPDSAAAPSTVAMPDPALTFR